MARSEEILDQFYRRRRTGAAFLLGYVLPVLHENEKGWYVDYYVRHPGTGKLVRKRIKLNRYKNINTRRTAARQLMLTLTARLQAGWTPWGKQGDRGMTSLELVLSKWEASKSRQLRHSAPYSYSSMTHVIREWMRGQGMLLKPAAEVGRNHIARFLQYLTSERQVSNRTYNNYLVFLGMMFRWMVENEFLASSPVENFTKRKPAPKSRTYLNETERAEMIAWIEQNDPDFLLPCLFVYGTLIRPAELRRLRVHHVDLVRHVILVPAEESKSGIERIPAIPDWMMRVLWEKGFDKYPAKCWLISSRLVPGDRPAPRNMLNRHWLKMRNALGWDQRHQLYSLRDTGIIQLLRDGVDLLHVMQQAGHTEVGTTNKYLKHAFPNGPKEVREKSSSLTPSKPSL